MNPTHHSPTHRSPITSLILPCRNEGDYLRTTLESLAAMGAPVASSTLVLDGNWDFVGRGNTIKLVKGDARCLSIAAASILAKVTRDRIMRAEAPNYPGYDFEFNKGYPCPRHKAALAGMGPTAIHRRSWVFMDHLPWTGIHRVFPAGMQEVLFD